MCLVTMNSTFRSVHAVGIVSAIESRSKTCPWWTYFVNNSKNMSLVTMYFKRFKKHGSGGHTFVVDIKNVSVVDMLLTNFKIYVRGGHIFQTVWKICPWWTCFLNAFRLRLTCQFYVATHKSLRVGRPKRQYEPAPCRALTLSRDCGSTATAASNEPIVAN